MPTTHDTDLRAFLASLTYRLDVRKPPDNRRCAQFRIGWNTQSISEKKLAAELSWNNLGYRAGKAFGPASDAKIHGTYDGFAAIYVRERGTAPPGDGPATPTASEPS